MRYIKDLDHTRSFNDRTKMVKQLLQQQKQIEELEAYIKQLESLLALHDLPSSDLYNLTRTSTDNDGVNVRKFFNNYEIFYSQQTSK